MNLNICSFLHIQIFTLTYRLVGEREKGKKSRLSSVEKVRFILRSTAHDLLKFYVYRQGIQTSQVRALSLFY